METLAELAEGKRNYFVSYTGVDERWAEWISWQLEEAGYTVFLQAWDFDAGAHFVTEMHRATQASQRTIAVLSNAYLQSLYAEAEWQAAWKSDPSGTERKLLVFRIEDCPRPGLLGQLVSIDLFNLDNQTARSRLLAAARTGRRKPPLPPGFPSQEPPVNQPPFPGRLVPGPFDEARTAGGPLTPDNPFAIAVAWWYSVLHEDYEALEFTITPESRGRWELIDLKERTKSGGITTGVMKPCYDIAYVRLAKEIEQGEGTLKVAGGMVPLDAQIIGLVLRPELGGWRVHGFGYPLDPEDMPRTFTMPPLEGEA